jgi:hypothetical protein
VRATPVACLFKTPAKLDYQNLVPIATRETLGFTRHSIDHLRRREGFALTDPGTDLYRRAGRGQLLHLVSQPGQGFLLARVARQGSEGQRTRRARRFASLCSV